MVHQQHDPEVTAMLPPVPDEPEPRYGHHAPAARWRIALDDASRWIVTNRAAFWSLVTITAAAAMAGSYIAGLPAGPDAPVRPPAAEASEKPTRRLDTPPAAPRPTRTRSPRVKRPAPVVHPRPTRTKKAAPTRSPMPSSAKPSKPASPTAPPTKPSVTPTTTGTPAGPPAPPEPPNEESG